MKPKIITGPFYFTRQATGMPQIKAKLPEMFRSGTFERAEINQDERTIPIVFATETPVDRWFGRERLICTPEACNIQRANNLGAFLSEHNRDKQIGVIVPNSTTFSADRKARTKLRFSKSNPLADQEWKDLNDGIRGLFSVGYVVHRLVLREENDITGDLYDAMDWEVLEVSLVSVPADANCTIDGRSENADNFPVVITADTQETSLALTNMRNRSRTPYFARFMAPDTGNNPQTPTGNQPEPKDNQQQRSQDADKAKADAGKLETERVRSLGFLGAKYGIQDKMLEFIEGGRSVSDLKDYIMDNDIRPVDRRNADPAPGQSPLLTGNGTRQAPLVRTIGEALANSEEYKAFAEGGRSKRSASFAFNVPSLRATLTTAAIPAGSITVERLPGIQPDLQQRLTIADLIAPGTTTSSKILFMQEINYTNAATTVAEGGQKPEASFALDEEEAPVRKIAVVAKVSDEMIADYAYMQSFIDSRLRFMVEEREEAQLLNGDGVSPNMTGILNTAGIQTQAKGADSIADSVHKAITKIRVTGRTEPTGVVLHPNDWERHALIKDANGQYMSGGPTFGPYGNGQYSNVERIWGLPVVPTTAITEGTGLVGAFRTQAQIFRRTGITAETTNSNEDDFEKNLISIRVEERLALCIYRPSAFATVTGLNA